LTGRLVGVLWRLAAVSLVGFGGANPAWAQARLGPLSFPEEKPTASKVFPDGGFPSSPAAPEGGIPSAAAPKGRGGLDPALHASDSDYGPAGYETRGPQEGPAVPEFYLPASDPLPPYYYRPSYYDTPGIGARPLADYAPPGYEPRETDEGQAPGTPEFTPIPPPAPITPEERQKYVTRGLFPGSFLVPGTNTSFRFRGFVRATALYDFDPIGSRDIFVPNTIPVPQQSGQNQNISARYSRIGLDTWTPTSLFEWNVHTFIEGDFFNGPAQAVGGGGNPFRLRFAFVDFGYFRVGQQNSVFQDGNAFPNTVDFQGPAGVVNIRRPTFRVTVPVCDKLYWAAGIEQPFSDITTNGQGTNVQDVPDFATHFRYESDLGHVQLSGLLRDIEYQPTGGGVVHRTGWGLSASTVFHPWAALIGSNPIRKANPSGLERCRVLMQYTFGSGIGRYISDTAGLGLDGQVDPVTGSFNTLFATGWTVSYEHWYTEKWLSNLTYSGVHVGSNGGQPGSTYTGAQYLALSLWFIPVRNMSLGVEYLWGQRENLDAERAQANRVNALFQYNF
jgi:hypothetical protein